MDDVAKSNPQFARKLEQLRQLRDLTKAAISEGCGIPPQTVGLYFEGSSPRAAVGLRLAKFLGVDPHWLFDEDQPWRDDFPQSIAVSLDNRELFMEVARRYRLDVLEVVEALNAVAKRDTMKDAEALYAGGLGHKVDSALQRAASATQLLELIAGKYSVENYAYNLHDELPGSDRHADDLLLANVAKRAREIQEQVGLLWIGRFIELNNSWQMSPDRRAHYEAQVPRFLDAIREGKAPDPLDNPLLIDQQTYSPGSGAVSQWRTAAARRREQMLKDGYKL